MRNMFSGNVQKEIPKSLGDCIKPDSVSSNLWVWCERLEKLGEILFWLLIIGGLIFSIGASIVEKEVVVKEATYWRVTRFLRFRPPFTVTCFSSI